MGIQLIELKTNGSYQEFMFQETTGGQMITWGDLSAGDIEKYLENNEFPEDKEYSQEDFICDVEKAGGEYPVSLWVENYKTAEFIKNLCFELLSERDTN